MKRSGHLDFRNPTTPPPQMKEGEFALWKVGLESLPSPELLGEILPPDEQERAGRFYFERDRARFKTTRAALRLLLSRYFGLPRSFAFVFGPRGKPHVQTDLGGPIDFNISHSHDIALIGLGRVERLGVDVEIFRPQLEMEEIARRFFAPEEFATFQRFPTAFRQRGFYEIWTRKEAVIKAIGAGVSYGLDSFAVSGGPDEEPRLLIDRVEPRNVVALSLYNLMMGPEAAGAVAVDATARLAGLQEFSAADFKSDGS